MNERSIPNLLTRLWGLAAPRSQRDTPDKPNPDQAYRWLELGTSRIAIPEDGLAYPALVQAAACIRRNEFALAIRQLDRAWRLAPDLASAIGPIYGRLLMEHAADYKAALAVLRHAQAVDPRPDTESLAIKAMLGAEDVESASSALQNALRSYCTDIGSPLAKAARELLSLAPDHAAGWVGLTPTRRLVGQILGSDPGDTVRLESSDGSVAMDLKIELKSGWGLFGCELQAAAATKLLEITHNGKTVFGSGQCMPADMGLDGRATIQGDSITGWVRLGNVPEFSPQIRVVDARSNQALGQTQPDPYGRSRRAFAIKLKQSGLKGDTFKVEAELPDSSWCLLPDAPLLTGKSIVVRPTLSTSSHMPVVTAPQDWARDVTKRPVDVVIPVYLGLQQTIECIESVLAHSDAEIDVIVVNDASPDAEVVAAIEKYATAGKISLLTNTTNLGFAASVNRAIQANPNHDVVVLNSDTWVPQGWLDRLRNAAYSAPDIGTVTPLTNDGTITSYPQAGGPCTSEEAALLDRFSNQANHGRVVELPVAVGFCMYLRRDCIADTGELDHRVFGKGYGEETDFCLRAAQKGWKHVLAADLFVLHSRGVSFGQRSAALQERSQRLLSVRHPDFAKRLETFAKIDGVRPIRRALAEARLLGEYHRFVLIVSLALRGGVNRFVGDRCAALKRDGYTPVVLRPIYETDDCELQVELPGVNDLRFSLPHEQASLIELLQRCKFEHIELQHFLGLPGTTVETILQLGSPYDIYVHDYVWFCPQITLIDKSGRYCGEPDVATCERCVADIGSNLTENITVSSLRQRSERWLTGARKTVAPSKDAADRLLRHFPGLKIDVKPIEQSLVARPKAVAVSGRIRVALVGAIGIHKGFEVLLACAKDAETRDLPLEFTIIGYSKHDQPLIDTGRVFITGGYAEQEFPELLRREQPNIILLPSVWPETWSYTLTYALASGLPIVAFDIGAIAERLKELGTGVLLPLESTPQHINDALIQLCGAEKTDKQADLKNKDVVPGDHSEPRGAAAITPSAGDGKASRAGDPVAPIDDPNEVTASVKPMPVGAGLYLFSVRSGTPSNVKIGAETLRLPAMHVSVGPGTPSHKVEFIPSNSVNGNWLTKPGDLLIAKVASPGAMLFMTTSRLRGGPELAVRFQKLEGEDVPMTSSKPTAPAVPAEPATVPKRAPALPSQPAIAAAPALPVPSLATADVSPPVATPPDPNAVRVQVGMHIRAKGDMTFSDVPWAGRLGKGHWVESFFLAPLDHLSEQDVEYKGLTSSGFESPWLSNSTACGTRGMNLPLIGFAIRLKTPEKRKQFECEYFGYFQSGVVVGPLKNGTPCRSTMANDALEGIQVRIRRRSLNAESAAHKASSQGHPKSISFGRYRDDKEDDISSIAMRRRPKPPSTIQ